MKKILVATRLEAQTHTALKDLADKQDRTICYLVRKAVEQYVQQQRKGRQAA